MSAVERKLLAFFKNYQCLIFKKGDLLITTDKDPDGVFLITSGSIRMFTISKEGLEITINIFKPLAFFPVGWLISDKQDKYYYQAITDSKAYLAPKDKVLNFLKNENDILFDLVLRIYQGLEGYFLRIESLISGEAKIRVLTNLIIHAKRFGKKENGQIQLTLKQGELSSLTGLTRETVNREIKKLRDKKLLFYKKQELIIKSIQELEKETWM